ncbi:unnamed protein product [Aphanomyces euteiches]|uniref:Uncharacterized protein n=1 Tax=Aphanomyces euteiches TaxID=100861 RepID=A0A6G0XW05_9STRA|nr:hypothetical protein Ae201684_001181 [Aphanomyces euteiches]KAH9087784.1 hypothetical protein LEN26_019808 [Aphanomyces euteiches]KAH9099521.1 hypothetical protein Ae201684P_018534 [Aphanomyces euteiches]KAH9114632.1 hypothetical protein AeMF1_011289 [Aphanomyces euteiches]KAH9156251.1 hypothetical protein AeRB84_001834 [Aphanomyces euteiches]
MADKNEVVQVEQAPKEQRTPSEYRISEKWDKCVESFVVNFSAGLVAGGITSLVLARSGAGRAGLTGFGAGAGVGATWTTCSLAFQEEIPKK